MRYKRQANKAQAHKPAGHPTRSAKAPALANPPDASTPIIEAHGLVKRYSLGEQQVEALKGVDLRIEQGSFVAVMGPSGSGKSTLLNLLGLLDVPDEGVIRLAGQETAQLGDDALTRLRRDRIGFVFQNFELIPTLSAQENILLPAEIAGKANEARAKLPTLAATLGIRDRLHHRPAELSGGQQQRVAMARALINRPALILADEPTGNLDSKSSEDVLERLHQAVSHESCSVVMVTHDLNAALYAERIVFLRDGTLVEDVTDNVEALRLAVRRFVGM